MRWVGRQSEAFTDTTRYLDIEGAIRSSKTTLACWKVLDDCLQHPGIHWMICRWTDDALATALKPVWRDILDKCGVDVSWHADEHYDEIRVHGVDGAIVGSSRVYLRGLKTTSELHRYAKFRGLTLAKVWVDQAEELPEDIYLELKGRLSQVGFPQQLLLTPNPAGESHWLSKEFPESNARDAHKYIRLSLDDNAHNLDAGYVAQLKRDYPIGHPLRRRLIEGKRGLNVRGTPVYAGYFHRETMMVPTAIEATLPLLEAIDFGHHHPCVVWAQLLPFGALYVLGGVMGDALFIEDFAPMLLQFRAQWFPEAKEVWTCCDPAGSHQNSQGVSRNGVRVLADHGIYARWHQAANMPEVRSYAVEHIGGYMRRGKFRCDPLKWFVVGQQQATRGTFAVDAFEAGYVWDERIRRTSGGKGIVMPLKDGYFEHSMNCLEYLVVQFGPAMPTVSETKRLEEKQLREAQRDIDVEALPRRVQGFRSGGRGGY